MRTLTVSLTGALAVACPLSLPILQEAKAVFVTPTQAATSAVIV